MCIPGHMQRGGSPSAYDRVLATEFGSYAAKLVEIERYGVTVAMVNGRVTQNRLADIAGKTRNVPEAASCSPWHAAWGVSLAEDIFLNALRVALSIFSGKYFDKSISAKPAGVLRCFFTARVAPTDRYIFRMNFFSGSY